MEWNTERKNQHLRFQSLPKSLSIGFNSATVEILEGKHSYQHVLTILKLPGYVLNIRGSFCACV